MKISTNVPAMSAIGKMKQVKKAQDENLFKLSSNDRIFKSAMDPAGLAISEKMKSRLVSNRMAKRNVNDGASVLQVMESTIGDITTIGVRLRELAMQAASDGVAGDRERLLMQKEFKELVSEVNRMAALPTYQYSMLNDFDLKHEVQIGLDNDPNTDRLSMDTSDINTSIEGLGMSGVNILSAGDARGALDDIDEMIHRASRNRTKVGSHMKRLESTLQNLEHFYENTSAGHSRIRDADVAVETANRAALSVREGAASFGIKRSLDNIRSVAKILG